MRIVITTFVTAQGSAYSEPFAAQDTFDTRRAAAGIAVKLDNTTRDLARNTRDGLRNADAAL
jgi:hypothetical protein